MANMSYCRFQNTRSDLGDCLDALRENKLLSKSEAKAGRWMFEDFLDFCRENCIIDGYHADEIEARKLLAETGADHVLYGRKLYNNDGELDEFRFYLLPMTDEEFEERVAPLKDQQVYAIHKMK